MDLKKTIWEKPFTETSLQNVWSGWLLGLIIFAPALLSLYLSISDSFPLCFYSCNSGSVINASTLLLFVSLFMFCSQGNAFKRKFHGQWFMPYKILYTGFFLRHKCISFHNKKFLTIIVILNITLNKMSNFPMIRDIIVRNSPLKLVPRHLFIVENLEVELYCATNFILLLKYPFFGVFFSTKLKIVMLFAILIHSFHVFLPDGCITKGFHIGLLLSSDMEGSSTKI